MTMTKRLEKHFVACAAAAAGVALLGGVNKVDAAVVHSGAVNIVIPDNIDGLYMNVVSGQTSPPLAPGFAGYDINPYSVAAGSFNLWGPTANTWFAIGGAAGNYNLPMGTMIQGAAAAFFRPGATADAQNDMVLNSSNNLLGFRLVNEANGNQVHFGWLRLQFGAGFGTRSIVEYAYEDQAGVGIAAGVIPAPGALALLGLAGLAGSRRRRN